MKSFSHSPPFLCILLSLFCLASADVYYVTNTNSSGAGSLYDAIEQANANGSGDIWIELEREEVIYIGANPLPPLTANPITIGGGDRGATIDARVSATSGEVAHGIFELDSAHIKLQRLELRHAGTLRAESSAIRLFTRQTPSSLEMEECWIHSCQTEENGAALNGVDGVGLAWQINLRQCTFSGNEALGDGGAVYMNQSSFTATHCTFSGNKAIRGGALFFGIGNSVIESSTIYNNSATQGGGLYSTDQVMVYNSILYNTTHSLATSEYPDNIEILAYGEGVYFHQWNLVKYRGLALDGGNDSINAHSELISGDPVLGALAFNGGLVPTHVPAYHSPVVDATHNSQIDLDARGYRRGILRVGSSNYLSNDLGAVELPYQGMKTREIPSGVYFALTEDAPIDLLSDILGFDDFAPQFPTPRLYRREGDQWIETERIFVPQHYKPGRYEFYFDREIFYDENPIESSRHSDPIQDLIYFAIELGESHTVTYTDTHHFHYDLQQALDAVHHSPNTHTIIIEAPHTDVVSLVIPNYGTYFINSKVRIIASEGLEVNIVPETSEFSEASQAFRIGSDGWLELVGITMQNFSHPDHIDYEWRSGLAIHNRGTLVLRQCVFEKNRHSELDPEEWWNRDNHCGVVHNQGNLWIEDTTFDGNSARQGAAIGNFGAGICHVQRSTFSHNSADETGGAIYNITTQRCSVATSTFSANSAQRGGAVSLYDVNQATFEHCTFAYNMSSVEASAIYDLGGANEASSFYSIFTGSSHESYGANAYFNFGSHFYPEHNLIETQGSNTRAHLKPLRNNGGYVKTHALGRESDAIDRASIPTLYYSSDARGTPFNIYELNDYGAFLSREQDFPPVNLALKRNAEGKNVLSYTPESNLNHIVEYSYDLKTWQAMDTILSGGVGENMEWIDVLSVDEGETRQRFYRVRIQAEN